jgi:hypothetical protein
MNDQEKEVWLDGYEAYFEGLAEDQNPYVKGTSLGDIWETGWETGFDEEA